MNEYYFTFGEKHTDKKGKVLRGCFTTIKAASAEEARAVMFNRHGNQFAFQYENAYQAGVEKFHLEYIPFEELASKNSIGQEDTISLFKS